MHIRLFVCSPKPKVLKFQPIFTLFSVTIEGICLQFAYMYYSTSRFLRASFSPVFSANFQNILNHLRHSYITGASVRKVL